MKWCDGKPTGIPVDPWKQTNRERLKALEDSGEKRRKANLCSPTPSKIRVEEQYPTGNIMIRVGTSTRPTYSNTAASIT